MSGQFIGLTMLVTLKSPPGIQVIGRVTDIVVGQSLTLGEVFWPANGWRQPFYTIHVNEITDLKELQNEVANPPPQVAPLPAQVVPKPAPAPAPAPVPAPVADKFADPAILSMGKRPTAQPAPKPVSKSPPSISILPRPSEVPQRKSSSQQPTAAKLVEPLQKVDLNKQVDVSDLDEAALDEVAEAVQAKKKSRRLRGRNKKNNGEAGGKEMVGANGWRQTPMLEPNPAFQPYASLKKKKGTANRQDNGWQTEDATDVQELGDFDFLGSLAKFDKKTVFNQIRADDLTADEDRLVAHNRLPRPGTNGGKNLHYTENVLDMGSPSVRGSGSRAGWNSEANETDEEEEHASQRDTGSGRNSRRAQSRLRGSASRKGSSAAVPGHLPRSGTSSSIAKSASTFVLLPSQRKCESVSALQMINLENIANNELGFSEDMIAENAGRGIAEIALAAFGKSKVHDLRKIVDVNLPTIVVFAGNNKNGIRAIAAARHLRNHGFTVVVCVLGLERELELLEDLRRQMKIFKSFGGKIFTKPELMDHIQTLQSPIQLVIDGLLGLTTSFDELRTGDQATALELIDWINRSKALVLTVDVPAGIDPTTGAIAQVDGKPIYIHTDFVVAMGAPKKGLLGAMTSGLGTSGSGGKGAWQLFVADIGLANTAWKKAGTRMRRGVDFEGTWVMEMRFQGLVN